MRQRSRKSQQSVFERYLIAMQARDARHLSGSCSGLTISAQIPFYESDSQAALLEQVGLADEIQGACSFVL